MTDISPERLFALLRCEPEVGKLFWLPRPIEIFATPRAFGTWNTRYAHAEAFTTVYSQGYRHSKIFERTYQCHRVIWAMVHGAWPEGEIDHINGVRHDNRIKNLREVTRSENQRNKKLSRNNSSGVMGVLRNKRRNKWKATIWADGRLINLGSFDSLEGAKASREKAQAKHGYHKNHGRKE